jgi:hypothetical protein
MNILNWIIEFGSTYWLDGIILLAIFLAGYFALKRMVKAGRTDLIYKLVLSLVVRAELKLGGKTGDFKEAEVTSWIYRELPFWLTWIFTKNDIAAMIDKAVEHLKHFLESGGDLLGYVDENYQVVIDTDQNK